MLSVCGFVVELFNGICALAPTAADFVSAAALMGWGGLSVHAQTVAILCDENLSLGFYFRGKAVHAVLSAGFAFLWILFFPWQ